MGNKIKKIIESEIQDLVFGRLSTIDLKAAKAISKFVRASSKDIAKKFIKVLSKEHKKDVTAKPTPSNVRADSAKTKKRTIKTKSVPKKSVSTTRKRKK